MYSGTYMVYMYIGFVPRSLEWSAWKLSGRSSVVATSLPEFRVSVAAAGLLSPTLPVVATDLPSSASCVVATVLFALASLSLFDDVSFPLIESYLVRAFALSSQNGVDRRREGVGVDSCSGLGLTASMAHLVCG